MEPIKKFDTFTYQVKDFPKVNSTYSQPYEEFEPESNMIIGQLHSVIESAEELLDIFKGVEQVDDWVQSKITISVDYLNTVRDYMKFNQD